MLIYLLKSGLCLLVLFGFYKLCLENENFHKIKRIYLLGALFLSFSLPLITFTYEVEIPAPLTSEGFEKIKFKNKETESSIINWQLGLYAILGIYLSGFIFFGFRFYKNLRSLFNEASENERLTELNYIYILLGQKLDPHSFFNYIFLNKTEFRNNKISKAVIEHEKAHVDQKHSLDILFIEALQIFFWFNPIFKWIKRSIKLNHEFLADKQVLSKDFNALEYSNILFNYSSGYHHNSLSSPINHSLIKKRIIMITKDFSIKKLLMSTGIFLPVLGCCIFFFNNDIVAKPVYTNEKTTVPSELIEVPFVEQSSDLNSNDIQKLEFQEPIIKIAVEGEKVYVNGEQTKIKDFTKAVDAMTSQFNEKELKNLNIHMKTNNANQEFMENLDKEFAKTRLSKVTGRAILPPPPPTPPAAGQIPPPPPPAPVVAPAPLHSVDAERVDRERAHELRKIRDNERETIVADRQRIREIEKQLREDEKLTKAERKKMQQDLKSKEAEVERKMSEVERRQADIEREQVLMERRQKRIQEIHENIPAPPQPPQAPDPIKSINELEEKGGSFYHNGKEISANEARRIVRGEEYSRIEIRQGSSGDDELELMD